VLDVRLDLVAHERQMASLTVGVTEGTASPVFAVRHDLQVGPDPCRVALTVADLPLPGGRFALWLALEDRDGHELVHWQPAADLVVSGPDLDQVPGGVPRLAPVHVAPRWVVEPA
jgi:ABC-2 type transport system ATP-binding protein